jgi:8-oxo-dGTP pyrophosphatase MutT (NUDIX family)
MGCDPSVKFSRASRLPKESPKELSQGLSKERQQVAAVCYRIGKCGVEFLLVQTRGGRWIFPKGGVESGLTQAQSAAIEAIEEAGVHGRMEELPFARYMCQHESASVAAHLCEVTRLEAPQESGRTPTWFSAEKAKQRLRKDRAPEFGAELASVIDRALSRIQRLHARGRNLSDRVYREGLREVRFEAFEYARLPGGHSGDLREAVFARYLHSRDARSSPAIEARVPAHLRRIPQIAARGEIRRPILRLGTGVGSPADTGNNITAIDGGRRATSSKPGNQPSSKSRRPKT